MPSALEMMTSGHGDRWESSYEALAYTAYALGTQVHDKDLAPLFTEVRGVLSDWENIEADRRRLRGFAISARANVRVADAALDRILSLLATSVLKETDGKADHDLYRRFFPEPHERVIALGLDAELPLAGVAMAQLDASKEEGGEAIPASLKEHIEPLRACLTIGNGSLGQRADAYADLGRLHARIEAWLETSESVRSAVFQDLVALGKKRGLAQRWATSFVAG